MSDWTRRDGQLADTIASGAGLGEGSDRVGSVLAGRFELIAHLGSGGTGTVYLARDRHLDEDVAIKLLHGRAADAIDLLRREVKLARRVTSPYVARIHELIEDGAERFLTMEFIDGVPLSDVIAGDNTLPRERALAILDTLCAGLEVVHDAGVVHGDVKPANVLVARDGRVVLADFGIARFSGNISDSRDVVGTPAYMAPEQVVGADLDHRADIYALGVIAFELFTGELPFTGRNAIEVASARLVHDPPDVVTLAPDAGDALSGAIRWMLARDPAARPSTIAAARQALAGAASETEVAESLPSVDVIDLYLKAQWLYRQFDRVDEAVELFDRARRQAPESAMVHAGYAVAAARKWMFQGIDREGLAESAEAAVEEAMRLGPQLGETRLARAAVALHRGEPVKAARAYRQALTLAPGLADAHSMVATLLLEVGELDAAERRLAIATRLDASLGRIFLSVATARGLAGDWSMAEEQLEAEIAPGSLALMMATRAAAYRRDRDALERLRAIGARGERPRDLVANALYNVMPDIFLGNLDLSLVYPLTAIAAPGMSRRRQSITLQMRAEIAGNAGDDDIALDAVEIADREGQLIDILWLDRCPLLDAIRDRPRFVAVADSVRARAKKIRDELL